MKVVAVTGATGGMGRILCERLAKQGCGLALCAAGEEPLKDLAEHLKKEYHTAVVTGAFNIYEEAPAAAFFERAEKELGKIDALVNLAGLSIPTKMETVTGEDFDRMMDVNVKGTLMACKHYALHAVPEGGLIINMGSMAARRANGNAPLYCTSKDAVNMLSAGMQIQLGPKDIRVTTLNPGGADTPFWGERKVDRSRLMQPEDVADVVLFVLDHSRMVFRSVDFESAAAIR